MCLVRGTGQEPRLGQGRDVTGAPWGRTTAALLGRMGLRRSLTAQEEWVQQSGGLGDPYRGEQCDPAEGRGRGLTHRWGRQESDLAPPHRGQP